jgi:hypothetical protein
VTATGNNFCRAATAGTGCHMLLGKTPGSQGCACCSTDCALSPSSGALPVHCHRWCMLDWHSPSPVAADALHFISNAVPISSAALTSGPAAASAASRAVGVQQQWQQEQSASTLGKALGCAQQQDDTNTIQHGVFGEGWERRTDGQSGVKGTPQTQGWVPPRASSSPLLPLQLLFCTLDRDLCLPTVNDNYTAPLSRWPCCSLVTVTTQLSLECKRST